MDSAPDLTDSNAAKALLALMDDVSFRGTPILPPYTPELLSLADPCRPELISSSGKNGSPVSVMDEAMAMDIDSILSFHAGPDTKSNEHNHRADSLVDDRFRYGNFSEVSIAQVAGVANDPRKSEIFPVILHKILSSRDCDDSIAWLSHGRAFAILDWKAFFRTVAPRYFCTYEPGPFLRWTEAYGFRRAECNDAKLGQSVTVFYHERFLRFRPWLAFTMTPGVSQTEDGGVTSNPETTDHTRQLIQCFDQKPELREVMISQSTLFNSPASFQNHLRFVAEPVSWAANI